MHLKKAGARGNDSSLETYSPMYHSHVLQCKWMRGEAKNTADFVYAQTCCTGWFTELQCTLLIKLVMYISLSNCPNLHINTYWERYLLSSSKDPHVWLSEAHFWHQKPHSTHCPADQSVWRGDRCLHLPRPRRGHDEQQGIEAKWAPVRVTIGRNQLLFLSGAGGFSLCALLNPASSNWQLLHLDHRQRRQGCTIPLCGAP